MYLFFFFFGFKVFRLRFGGVFAELNQERRLNMASLPHSPATISNTCASDLLRSSFNGVNGVPLRFLGRRQEMVRPRDSAIVAKIKKWKKNESPWPDGIDLDPNVKGGNLSYLSHFKPLKEKPKPVTLAFEKPLRDLEKKIMDVSLHHSYLANVLEYISV